MKKGIFDTHAHYNDKKFEGEGEKFLQHFHIFVTSCREAALTVL